MIEGPERVAVAELILESIQPPDQLPPVLEFAPLMPGREATLLQFRDCLHQARVTEMILGPSLLEEQRAYGLGLGPHARWLPSVALASCTLQLIRGHAGL